MKDQIKVFEKVEVFRNVLEYHGIKHVNIIKIKLKNNKKWRIN